MSHLLVRVHYFSCVSLTVDLLLSDDEQLFTLTMTSVYRAHLSTNSSERNRMASVCPVLNAGSSGLFAVVGIQFQRL